MALILGAIGALFLKAHIDEFPAAMAMTIPLPPAIRTLSIRTTSLRGTRKTATDGLIGES